RFIPTLGFEREHKRDTYADSLAGFLFHIYRGGIKYQTEILSLETSQELREDQKYQQNDLKDFSAAQTQNYKAALLEWHNLSGDALYTHRLKNYQNADSAATRTDLLEMNLGWTPWRRSVDLMAHYRINNTRVSSIIQIPIYVGPGQGTHSKSGDLFYEDPDGEYILIAQNTGDFQPVVELEGSLSLDLDPHRLPEENRAALPSPWRLLASQTVLNFSEKTKERDIWALYRLDFAKFQGDSTLHGNVLLREDLFLFRHHKDLSFRLRGELYQSLSNLYLSGGYETRRRSLSLRVRRSFNERWSAQFDVSRKFDIREYRLSTASDRDIHNWELALEPSYKPSRQWEFGMRLVAQQDVDWVQDLRAVRYGLEPRAVRNFTEKGRAELRAEWHRVSSAEDQLPFEMAAGDPPGDNFRWDLRVDYRISKYLSATLSYTGSKDADKEAIHVGRAEVRAFF
ncbi:MAG: hypothetical protein ABH878_09430, partial [bacterium]